MTTSQSSIFAAPDDNTLAAVTSADEDGGVLPLWLVREVLVHLPAKPLCCLRAVCRSWRSLLSSDPAFIAAHPSHHLAPLFTVGIVVATAWGKMMRVDMVDASGALRNQAPTGWWRSNPKVMVRTDHHLAAVAVEDRCLRLRVVNLASGVVSFVLSRLQDRDPHPSAGAPRDDDDEDARRRRCKPSHRFMGLFLGHAASREHKAVRICGDLASQTCEVVTICPDDGDDDGGRARWQERQAPLAKVLFWTPAGLPDAAIVDRTAYFLVDPSRQGSGCRGALYEYTLHDFVEGGIACFDLAAKQWSPRLLSGPPSIGTEEHDISYCQKSHVSLTTLNGHLVVVHRNDDGKTLDLWFRTESSADEEDGEAASWIWSRRYVIPYDVIMPNDSGRDAEPLWEMADGRVAMWVWGSYSSAEEGRQGHLRMYNPTGNKCVDVLMMSSCLHVGAYTGGMLSEY